MLMILFVILGGAILAMGLLRYADSHLNGFGMVAALIGVLLSLALAVSIFLYVAMGWQRIAANYKADIINREYGTSYTAEEIFWAGDVIETIRVLDRQRIEVSGDLLREEGK